MNDFGALLSVLVILGCILYAKHLERDDVMFSHLTFNMKDFHNKLGVLPLEFVQVDDVVFPYLQNHTMTDAENVEELKRRSNMFHTWSKFGTASDQRFYVKFIDENKGFGLFSQVPIRKNDVLGLYTGVITSEFDDTDYLWTYPSVIKDKNGRQVEVGIDAKYSGNWFRFVNDGPESLLNVEGIWVLHDGLWHMFYVASRHIAPHEELLISYGDAYWQTRNKTQKI